MSLPGVMRRKEKKKLNKINYFLTIFSFLNLNKMEKIRYEDSFLYSVRTEIIMKFKRKELRYPKASFGEYEINPHESFNS